MNKEEIIKFIQGRHTDNKPLSITYVKKKYSSIFYHAQKNFGGWKEAIEASGFQYAKVKSRTPLNTLWTKDRVISTIQMYHLNNIPLNFRFINEHHLNLRKKAEKFFDSWGDAVVAAGINYEEVKKNKGWSQPFLSEDGILYSSPIKGSVANELFELKSEGKIIDYTRQQAVTFGKQWICDFVITLLNGANVWLEVEKIREDGDNKQQDKLDFYKRANFFYCKVNSSKNIKNIMERYNNWFSLPVCDCLITAHENPDGDALASMVAIYNFLLKQEKKAAIRVSGSVPRNLAWMLEGIETVKKVPEWAEMVVVLDCAPTKDRMGWELPALPVYNIDHHVSRLEDNDPDNGVHVLNACSTASLLFSRFGLREDILAVGVYTDTLFIKRTYEVFHFLDQLGLSEEILEKYISKITANSDKKLWDILQDIRLQRCKNGFVIIELEEEHSPGVLESLMQVLMKLNESVCLIYGKDFKVKLRTLINIDVSKLAEEYGGGGHAYAAACQVDGKIVEFKNAVKSLSINERKEDEVKTK